MDPVNPAPAGNPQLTTHLLVSHKKNKNFHPSKVSLKRVNIITCEVPLLCKPVPHRLRFIWTQSRQWSRRRGKLQVTELLHKPLDQSQLLTFGLTDQPCTVRLEFHWTKIFDSSSEDRSNAYTFKDVKFVLQVLDWDDAEILHLTESNLSEEKLLRHFGDWFSLYEHTDIGSADSFSMEYSWNKISVKIGDSQTYVVRDDQPLHLLVESDPFFRKNSSLMSTRRQQPRFVSFESMLPVLHDEVDGEQVQVRYGDRSRSQFFGLLAFLPTSLSKYLEFLCKKAEAADTLTPKLKSLMQEMVQKIVYYIEPFMVAIVLPMLEDMQPTTYRDLAVKMRDVFEKLQSLQTLDSLESLEILDSCLYCDWEEMLTLLAELNVNTFNKHLKAFIASDNPTNLNLMSRLYDTRIEVFSPLVDALLNAAYRKDIGVSFEFPEYQLVEFTPKYQCWISTTDSKDTELFICLSPNEFTEERDEDHLSASLKKIDLGLPNQLNNVKVEIFQDLLVLIGLEGRAHILDLRAIMNGPDEQTLRDVTKGSFPFQSESALQEYDRRCILSKTALVLLVATLSDPRMTFKLNWYDFKSVSSQSCQPSDAGVIDAEGCSSFECKILPNCKVVLGFFCEQVTLTESVPTRTTLRLILFQYQQTWNQLKQVSDETHPIDEMFISQLPTVSDPLPVKSMSFVEHKKKVFCVVNPHMSKQVKQIFCLHRERFVAIGGTNCRRPGLYVIGRNTVNYHQYKYEKLGRPFGFGLSEHLDLKQGAIRTKYFELVPSF